VSDLIGLVKDAIRQGGKMEPIGIHASRSPEKRTAEPPTEPQLVIRQLLPAQRTLIEGMR